MIESLKNLAKYSNSKKAKDTSYSGRGGASAITLGARTLGGSRGMGYSTGGTFDYLSTAENTIECYYQKLDDLRYYESHALTEKVIGLFRDYITQLWKEGSQLVDVPGEDENLVEELNRELEAMDVIELLMKDLTSVIFYGSVSYEISRMDEKDPNYKGSDGKEDDLTEAKGKVDKEDRSIYKSKDAPSDRKYSILNNENPVGFYDQVEREYASETERQRAKRLVNSTDPKIKNLVDSTSPSSKRGVAEARELQKLDNSKLNSVRGSAEAPFDGQKKVGDIKSKVPHAAVYRLNKLKSPHHTIVEYDRKVGRRYLVKATEKYHIPTNKHKIFYYGNDSMRLSETNDVRVRGKTQGSDSNISQLIGAKSSEKDTLKRYKRLGINPKDPKKTPTRYELLERELSAGSPLFYHHLPKVRELFLKDLVTSILGIKDVIQPDILAMNFEGGSDIDHAQDLCNDLEDLLNKNSDYSIFNSAALDYNDLTKLLIDTVRVLPDIEGKLQSLNPIRTTSLQEKIQQIRMESKELERDILSSLGVPVDLFEGQSSKWEVIKRSERLQSKVDYYINTLKGSIRRLAQSIYYLQNNRELKASSFKVTSFNESDLDIAQRSNKLQNLTELSQTLLNIVVGAERELMESRLVNKQAYFSLLKSNLKEIYPEIEDLLDIDTFLKATNSDPGEDQQGFGGGY
jgi:hypothetical protein